VPTEWPESAPLIDELRIDVIPALSTLPHAEPVAEVADEVTDEVAAESVTDEPADVDAPTEVAPAAEDTPVAHSEP
jgi:hypothetical protein